MITTTITCDGCGAIISVVHRHAAVLGEYCAECVRSLVAPLADDGGCAHEENVSDEVPGRETARLVCKKCGYDRTVNVATKEVVA